MFEFSKKVAVAHTYIKTIILHVDRMSIIKGRVQNVVGTDKEQYYSDQITANVDEVQNTQSKMKMLMEQMSEDVKLSKEVDKVKIILIKKG